MTKSQIWIASFLGLFLILFGISYLTEKKEIPAENEQTAVEKSQAAELNANDLIKNNGCTTCHGSDLRGSNLGPSLIGVKQYWSSREELISYLRNPSSFMDKDRFKDYKERFTMVVMPPFNNVDIKDLGKIADYLLKL